MKDPNDPGQLLRASVNMAVMEPATKTQGNVWIPLLQNDIANLNI
jgi:hypothetical protein